jgi:hypothetical protein
MNSNAFSGEFMSYMIYRMDRDEIVKAILMYLDEEKGFKCTEQVCEFFYTDGNLSQCDIRVEASRRSND